MGVANKHDVDMDINLKSSKESTAEVTFNDFDLCRSSTSFLSQALLGVDRF